MKTINLLKNLINLLFWGMIVCSILGFIAVLFLFFSPESLPVMFQGYRMLFETDFPWQIWIAPLSYIIGFILFIISIFYLKRCLKPFQENQFYSEVVIDNLKKSGRLFIIIVLGTSLTRIIAAFAFSTYANISLIGGSFGSGHTFAAVLSAIGNVNFFLLIIGLFLLVFSSALENGKLLKEENDLTI